MAPIETGTATDRPAASAAHLAPLPGSEWSVWRSVCVRGAGFPADTLLSLAAPASAAAADALLAAERRLADLEGERRRLRRQSRAARRAADPAPVPRVQAGAEAPACESGEGPGADVLAREIQSAGALVQAARSALKRAFDADAARISGYLRQAVSDPHLREAVLWQNRQAVHTAFEPLLRAPAARGASDRMRKERLVASYLQRYCAKNDTIGFFGPVGWARFVDDGPAIRMAPGPQLLEHRAVHFEGWAINALARALDRRAGVRPWIAPRLLPQVRIDGTQLCIPGRDPVTIVPAHARLLRACDGQQSARRLARELGGDGPSGPGRERDVYASLAAFEQMGLVTWSLQGPLERDADRTLRARLDQIGDAGVRIPCLAALDRLEACREDVARAAGDPEALDRSLARLEATFTSLADTSATRSPGQTYAGRTLVYEECRRDAAIDLGPALLERLGPPLALLLESARWYSFEIARRYRAEVEAIVHRLIGRTGRRTLDLAVMLAEGPHLGPQGEIPPPIAELLAELRRRWAAILAVPPAPREARYGSADLRPRVRAAFAAPAPGWTWARHISPDLMIAADGAAAIARGEYTLVLGEIHLVNTLLQSALASEHPDPHELALALDADCATPLVVPVHGRDVFTDRTAIGLLPSRAFWYESSHEIAPGPRAAVLRTSDLVVESDAGGLWVRARDGRARLDAVEFLGYFLAFKCAATFGLFADAPHLPRVTIDDVVVSRERWQMTAGAIEWASAGTPVERFAGARRWTRALGIPRFAFVKVPVERKPCYVDFDSPIYVDAFAKLVRQSAGAATAGSPITISEMLPTLDQLWLADAEGRRYTSELRLVAVDPRVPRHEPRAAGAQP